MSFSEDEDPALYDRAGEYMPPLSDMPCAQETARAARFYTEQNGRMARYFMNRVPRDSVADFVHDSFVRLFSSSFWHSRQHAGPYLGRIAGNLVIDEARSARVHQRWEVEALANPDAASVDPVAQLEARSELERIEAILRKMPERRREIFLMHRLDGLSYEEIGERIGMKVKGIEKQMAKALFAIRRPLGDR